MQITKRKLYLLLFFSTIVGYIWVFINLNNFSSSVTDHLSFCFIKQTTNIPCPSCGSTRSVAAILNGDIIAAIYWNPIGIILFLLLIIIPFWLLVDVLFNNDSLLKFYLKAEKVIRKPKIAFIAILLVIINWIWNIYKGL